MNVDRAPNLKFSMLSEQQIQNIHNSSIEVLEKAGAKVMYQQARDVLRKAGCQIDGEIVKFSRYLVEEMIKCAPKNIDIYDRDQNIKMSLGGKNVYFGTGQDCPFVLDLITNERRESKLKDVENFVKLTDWSKNLDFVMSLCVPNDVDVFLQDTYSFKAMVSNSKKPIVFTCRRSEELTKIYNMALVTTGDENTLRKYPTVIYYAEPISPLIHAPVQLKNMLYCAEKSIPLVYAPAPIAGATAPVTVEGLLAQANAETLSGLVIQQLFKEGAPFIYGGIPLAMDMKETTTIHGPESHMGSVAVAEMARYYKLPVFGNCGVSDAKIFDEQVAAETSIQILMSSLSGQNLIHNIGLIDQALTACYQAIVLCDEMISYVRRMMRGFSTNSEKLAIEEICSVGPGGNYVSSDHTFKYFKDEIWYPELLDRKSREVWQKLGSKDLGTLATEKVVKVLDKYNPEKLSSKIEQKIKAIVKSK